MRLAGWRASSCARTCGRTRAPRCRRCTPPASGRGCCPATDPEAVRRVGQLAGIDDVQGACLPDDKLSRMRQAQAEGATVAMVGDGLNDGPVLAGADVSFAFGRAVPLARAQADFVVLGERLALIPGAFVQARRTMRVVRQNLGWAVAYNVVGVPLAMAGWMSPWAAGLGGSSPS
jgi:Cu2+-exporting ATPase